LRIVDLVELERSKIKKAPDGNRAIILRPNKRRRRIVNMPLTPTAEAIIDKAPISRRLILKPKRADAWDSARLSREVREYATQFGIRPELRFNDLRGSKVTEMVWSRISVPDLAIRIGWKIETAAKMLGRGEPRSWRPRIRRSETPEPADLGNGKFGPATHCPSKTTRGRRARGGIERRAAGGGSASGTGAPTGLRPAASCQNPPGRPVAGCSPSIRWSHLLSPPRPRRQDKAQAHRPHAETRSARLRRSPSRLTAEATCSKNGKPTMLLSIGSPA
jgi:hypothetical protein